MRYNSFKTYCAALEKLSVGLNWWAQHEKPEPNNYNSYNWTAEIQIAKAEAKELLDSNVKTRAYRDPAVKPEQFLGNKQYQIVRGKGGKDRIAYFRQEQVYEQYRQLVMGNLNPDYNRYTLARGAYRQALKAAAA
jgi:hypothetical protein